MTKHKITAKIAEAKYLQRVRIKDELDVGGGDAESDWLWAERAIAFFESKDDDPVSDAYKLEEFGWVGPLYYQLVEGGKES